MVQSYCYMKERKNLARLSARALQRRRQGLVKQLPQPQEILRGSLVERYLTCGHPGCKCARGERHGPSFYLSVTLGPRQTTGTTVAAAQLGRVRQWLANYRTVKQQLDGISEINRELLRRERKQGPAKSQS